MNPNVITALRIFIAPVFAYLFIFGSRLANPAMIWGALVGLILIELSDAVDGYVARSQNKVSDFGKFFDPVADSISRLTIFAGFLVAEIIPLWMFLIFLYRDTFVSALRYLCIKKGTVVAARVTGKFKAVFQGIGSFLVTVVALMHAYDIFVIPQMVGEFKIGFLIMLFPALFTAYSAIDYYLGTRNVIEGTK